jgi:Icc-related predicted phosphoesterase
MRLVIVSDTHGRQEALGILRGGVLIHCGDSSNFLPIRSDELEQRALAGRRPNLLDGDEMAAKWALIPDEVEILITHTPPYGMLDRSRAGRHFGCPDLQRRMHDLQPRIHSFRHVHESAGQQELWGTRFVNACSFGRNGTVQREAVVIEV